MMHGFFDFASIILADIVLSGDNAMVIGMAAASLSPELRNRAIFFGIAVAAILRIIFAVFATYLLAIEGLLFVGGLLLLWVSFRLYKEIREGTFRHAAEVQEEAGEGGYKGPPKRTIYSALSLIVIADVSMSIDNVLAVAAIARENMVLLVFGLALSILLMAFCAKMIVRLLMRFSSISWIGLAILVYVSCHMLWEGWPEMAALITTFA